MILDALHSERSADLAPDEVWAVLPDEGTYLGSVSTYYRVLREAGESRERRRQATHPAAVRPELVATGPNQVCSWDITKLHGPAKMGLLPPLRHPGHPQPLRRRLDGRDPRVRRAGGEAHRQPVLRSAVQTLRYRPAFPARFPSVEAARAHCQDFFAWYNNKHRHGGLGLHTAADFHHGRAAAVQAQRGRVLDAACHAHPERFVSKPPAPPKLPGTSWINPPQEKEAATQ